MAYNLTALLIIAYTFGAGEKCPGYRQAAQRPGFKVPAAGRRVWYESFRQAAGQHAGVPLTWAHLSRKCAILQKSRERAR